jgi:hypothetical protein
LTTSSANSGWMLCRSLTDRSLSVTPRSSAILTAAPLMWCVSLRGRANRGAITWQRQERVSLQWWSGRQLGRLSDSYCQLPVTRAPMSYNAAARQLPVGRVTQAIICLPPE